MIGYYSAIVFITIATMLTMIVHLFDNETLSRKSKYELRIIASLIILGVLCEYLGFSLNNSPPSLKYAHGLVKAVEFTVAPTITAFYAKLVKTKEESSITCFLAVGVLIINAICEVVSIFTPFIFLVDRNNMYNHGRFYGIYIAIYFTGIVFFIVKLLKYTKRYQSRNIATLFSIVSFLIAGFLIRMIDNSIYSNWLVVAITYTLFFIYYSDLSLKVDALTLLLNRKSYQYRLKKIDYATAIVLFDANDFKEINDTYGHQCGDRVLEVIAQTIIETYGKYAYCYRIGGDEFCAIFKPGAVEKLSQKENNLDFGKILEEFGKILDEGLAKKYEEYPMLKNGVSKGYGIYYGSYDVTNDDSKSYYTLNSVKDVVKIADENMYANKQRMKKSE